MIFELLLDVMDRFLRTPGPITLTLRESSFGVAISQALRARLRSHRPSGPFRNRLQLGPALVSDATTRSLQLSSPRARDSMRSFGWGAFTSRMTLASDCEFRAPRPKS